MDISPAIYRSTVDVKVLENVGLNFVRGKSLYSSELGFAAPECRLVRACNLITVTGAQKCLFYLAGFRSDCARVIEEYNASVRPFQQWRHWPEAGFNRQHLFSSITSGFFLIPSRLSLITYRTQSLSRHLPQRQGNFSCELE